MKTRTKNNRTKIEKETLNEKLKRLHKMDEEEVRKYHEITKRSGNVHKDKSKFDKKKSRQMKRSLYEE